MGLGPTQGDERRPLFSNDSAWKHHPPLCHLDRSAAQWRDLRFSCPFLEIFFDRGIMGLRPTQGDEKRLLFSNDSAWKHRPPLCHLDRSAAQWRDLRFSCPFLEMFFDRADPDFLLRNASNDHVIEWVAQVSLLRPGCSGSDLLPNATTIQQFSTKRGYFYKYRIESISL